VLEVVLSGKESRLPARDSTAKTRADNISFSQFNRAHAAMSLASDHREELTGSFCLRRACLPVLFRSFGGSKHFPRRTKCGKEKDLSYWDACIQSES